MIETYFHSGEGYNPFLVREGVASGSAELFTGTWI